jgi:hypothetical protein
MRNTTHKKHKAYKTHLSLTKKHMNPDQTFQAGLTAAIQAFYATANYPVVGFSYSYTPGVVPAVEDVPVTFPA